MKYTIAVATLLGLVSAEEPVWKLRSLQDHRIDAQIQKDYGDFSTSQANGRDPYSATFAQLSSESSSSSDAEVQLKGADDEPVDHSKELFKAFQAVPVEEDGYHRVIPANFSGDDDDIFMRSMLKTYAVEHKNFDGSPNGVFGMGYAQTKAAASEVLGTHKGLTGAALKSYIDTYFDKAWAHFDVNKTGEVVVYKMPQFMRFLASDQYLSLKESA